MKPKRLNHTLIFSIGADGLKAMQNRLDRIMRDEADRFNRLIDKAVKMKLEQLGFTFEDEKAWLEFLKTRCTGEFLPSSGRHLLIVDGKPTVSWRQWFDTDFQNGKYTFYCNIDE